MPECFLWNERWPLIADLWDDFRNWKWKPTLGCCSSSDHIDLVVVFGQQHLFRLGRDGKAIGTMGGTIVSGPVGSIWRGHAWAGATMIGFFTKAEAICELAIVRKKIEWDAEKCVQWNCAHTPNAFQRKPIPISTNTHLSSLLTIYYEKTIVIHISHMQCVWIHVRRKEFKGEERDWEKSRTKKGNPSKGDAEWRDKWKSKRRSFLQLFGGFPGMSHWTSPTSKKKRIHTWKCSSWVHDLKNWEQARKEH